MNCNKCDGTLVYFGSFKSGRTVILKDEVYSDKHIPTITFCFTCRCCDNQIILDWSNGLISYTQNYGTPEVHYITPMLTNER